MNLLCFQTSAWYYAITLTERIASLRAVQRTRPNVEVNSELADQRMQRWRSQPPFTNDSFFAQRLAMDGITEDELLYLLGEPIEAINDRFLTPPRWLAELGEACSRPPSNLPLPLPEVLRGEKVVGFLDAIEPLISQGRDRLHQGVQTLTQTYSKLPFDLSTVEEVLFANLPGQLLTMLGRTMVLELNVARLQGFLEGNTAEERFQSFLQRVRQRDTAVAILREYPALARQLTIRIHNWVTFSLEFLQHLCEDWQAIRSTFTLENEPGVLVQVNGSVGDRHRGGRAVLIARFSSGFQVVYKPKSLAVDVHFQELLTWINERGNHPPFRMPKILNRSSYGWVEFVTAQGCTSSEEIWRFYQRQGGYLALLYALEATDFHFENLIAVGEYPMLLDLEALFQPRTKAFELDQAEQLASSTINYSVLRIGLLPERLWSNVESEGIDFSGLGAIAGQLTPYDIPYWEGAGTDEMRLAHKQMTMAQSQNRPTLNGNEVDVLDYAEAIVAGFTSVYQLLLEHRAELLAGDGPLARFAEDEVRAIFRSTRTYAWLLRDSFHPDVLRNALERDRFFDRLWLQVEHLPYLAKVIPAEREDLLNGDIPMFTTRPGSRHVWSSSNEQISNFFDESGMALAQRRVQRLSDEDLTQQLWVIRASLISLAMGGDGARWPTYQITEPKTEANRERLLTAAQAVGDRLEVVALRGEQDVSWIGLTLINERHWSLVPLGINLYDGLPGVVLFLAYLGDITKEERYTTLAQAALTTLRHKIGQSFLKSIGGFNGRGGLIYTLAHLGVLWNEPALLAEAQAVVELLPAMIDLDEHFDIISGAAGCIGSLLSLYRCYPSDRTLAVAIQCGEYLIARAQPMEHGIGWLPKFGGTKPLTGFSHGAAGMAWALLELAAVTGEERFRKAALEAIAYERSLFRPEVSNWPDLRDFATTLQADNNNQHTCMTAWCHGAPGIGLARLRCLQHLDDAETRSEINAALKTTLAHGFGGNHSLCHGDLGNLELLLQASEILDEPQWGHQVNHFAAIILESINQHGWLCGIPLGVESPGLMTGLAGIGYELLRLAEPTRVPSVLMLEPPVPNSIG
ncbi:MAG TPA: type 2 lanthipeptide synthetase LanM family protein [Coleofasciculaceae cyanobacterium]|jgi:type 2 lantibiotic biosynthesis protein LanM